MVQGHPELAGCIWDQGQILEPALELITLFCGQLALCKPVNEFA
jgi:hypothetical protein